MENRTINLHGYLEEDLVDYKRAGMFLAFPKCSFKCAKELGIEPKDICQNYSNIEVAPTPYDLEDLWKIYDENPLTECFILGGLEPMDSFDDVLKFVKFIREEKKCNDVIVIYSGYYDDEIADKMNILRQYIPVIIKCGRYKPGQKSHYDRVLGVNLANIEQYGVKLWVILE